MSFGGAGGYLADVAHRRTRAGSARQRVMKCLQPGNPLWDHVTRYSKARYSPEQITGTLALVHPDTPSLRVSHETIYTAIYALVRGALRKEVIR